MSRSRLPRLYRNESARGAHPCDPRLLPCLIADPNISRAHPYAFAPAMSSLHFEPELKHRRQDGRFFNHGICARGRRGATNASTLACSSCKCMQGAINRAIRCRRSQSVRNFLLSSPSFRNCYCLLRVCCHPEVFTNASCFVNPITCAIIGKSTMVAKN